MRFYNYLSRKKEEFVPLRKRWVGLYTCGPTVYDRVHIGNLRTYIFEDVLKRSLEYNGYRVKHVMNITDVEDKIIQKMNKEKKRLKEVTLPNIKNFLKDIEKLNIKKADYYPKATEHIKEIINLIAILLKKGIAYKGKNGSVYFDISKYKKYGQLSGLKKNEIKIGARVEKDEYNKKNIGDFVLWKAFKKNEPFWDSPFGKGRPGWHIECSAMSMRYLGNHFDIHAGAVDLIFPHHENEIAQSESATNEKFVNYWIEGEHLLVDGRKMSKSLGNFYTLADIEERKFNPLAFRYFVLNSHYRSQLNFSWQALESAEKSLRNLRFLIFKKYLKRLSPDLEKEKFYRLRFKKAVDDDLNTPKMLKVVWNMLRDISLNQTSKRRLIFDFDKILALNLAEDFTLPYSVKKLAQQRENLRKKERYEEADKLRAKIQKMGWLIEDTKFGSLIGKVQ